MYDNSPEYYQLRFKECGAEPGDIKTLEDLRKLPIFMDKDRERQSMEASLEKYGHPFGLHLSLHPGGRRPGICRLLGRSHAQASRPGPRRPGLLPLSPGGYATSAILPGLEKSGILPLPIDIRLGPQPALEMVKWTRPTFWYTGVAIVEFYIDILKNKMGIDPRTLGFKCLLLGGETGCGIPELKQKVEEALGCRWYDWWGPSLLNFAISCDSEEYHGLHNFAAEWDFSSEDIVDPETKEPLAVRGGVVGEMVGTHLLKKASPYLRYATGDIVEVLTSECPACGFKGYRVKVLGRADDMITVKGVNVFAGAIHKTLQQFVPRITGHMRVVKESPSARLAKLVLKLEYGEGMADRLEELGEEITQVLRSTLRISPVYEWVPPETLDRPIRKPILFEKRY